MADMVTDDLSRAHAEIRSHFMAPGATVPSDLESAMQDPLWAALVRARAASNRFHARQAARFSGLAIHHRENPMPIDLIAEHQDALEAQHHPEPVPAQLRESAQAMYRSGIQRIADWEHILDTAAETGIARLSASMDCMGQMTIKVLEAALGRWVFHLARFGYRFADPVSAQPIEGGIGIVATAADGTCIHVHAIKEASQCA